MVNWISVMSLLAIESMHELPRRSIDFVLAFPQSDLDVDLVTDLPLVMLVDGNRGEYVIKWNKSLYGIKQESKNWFDPIKNCLERRGYHQSKVDPCVFYRRDSVIWTNVDCWEYSAAIVYMLRKLLSYRIYFWNGVRRQIGKWGNGYVHITFKRPSLGCIQTIHWNYRTI